METSESKSILKTSKCPRCRQNRTPGMVRDKAWRKPVYCPCGDRCKVGVNIFQAFTRNRRTCRPDVKGEPQVATPQGESTDAGHRGGVARSSNEGAVMALERRGSLIQSVKEDNQ
jgi:hypothetical protein